MTAQSTVGTCENCGKADALLVPLHAESGGPQWCVPCGLDWHGKFARRRKLGRVVTRAIKAFLDAGGAYHAVERLQLAASGVSLYEGEADTIGAAVGDITTELLDDVVRLTHPDRHPPERRELATRVTQELLALRPFVFPAPEPEPEPEPTPRNGYVPRTDGRDSEPLRITYPCELCRDQVPYYYCGKCRATWEDGNRRLRERERAKTRALRLARRARQLRRRPPSKCACCGEEFNANRKDARYCSAACRQRAHRVRVTDKQRSHGVPFKSRYAEATA